MDCLPRNLSAADQCWWLHTVMEAGCHANEGGYTWAYPQLPVSQGFLRYRLNVMAGSQLMAFYHAAKG